MSERKLILISLVLVLFLGPVTSPDTSYHIFASAIEKISVKTQATEATEGYYNEAPVVNLPPGEKFVQFIPASDENAKDAFWKYHDQFLTERRPAGENPRRLTFYGPGISPHSLVVRLYIQEH